MTTTASNDKKDGTVPRNNTESERDQPAEVSTSSSAASAPSKKKEKQESSSSSSLQQQQPKKRKASTAAEEYDTSSNEGSPKRPRSDTVPLDLAPKLGLNVGDRIEVHWEIERPNGETNAHWWGAELLKHDGRTTDSVAIRTIQYDPKPELGFEACQDDVIFLGDDLIVTPDSQTQLHYRREGHDSEEEVFWYNEGDLDAQLNSILMGALDKNRNSWKNLSPVQQAIIAEKIASKKEKLKEALMARDEVITSEIIKDVLQKSISE